MTGSETRCRRAWALCRWPIVVLVTGLAMPSSSLAAGNYTPPTAFGPLLGPATQGSEIGATSRPTTRGRQQTGSWRKVSGSS